MGKRNLYPTISQKGNYEKIRTRMNIIANSDGEKNFLKFLLKYWKKIRANFKRVKSFKKIK